MTANLSLETSEKGLELGFFFLLCAFPVMGNSAEGNKILNKLNLMSLLQVVLTVNRDVGGFSLNGKTTKHSETTIIQHQL